MPATSVEGAEKLPRSPLLSMSAKPPKSKAALAQREELESLLQELQEEDGNLGRQQWKSILSRV